MEKKKNQKTVALTAKPIIPLLPYQREDVESPDRFRWNCWSRQTGKSFTKSLRRILRGVLRRRNQIFLSAGERQSRELMDKARQHCQALQIAADFHENQFFQELSIKQLEITLPGKVRIIGLPANPMTARGFTGDVFLDEFAMHAEDRDIWAALFPTVLRRRGELDIASTPKGRNNMFHELMDNARFSHSTVTLPDAVAQGLDVDAEELRGTMNDDLLYRQEFLCEFLDESTAFLTHEQIGGCVDPLLIAHSSSAPLVDDPRDMFVGVDIGRHRDLTVLWVLAVNHKESRTCPPVGGHAIHPHRERCGSEENGPSIFTTAAIIELAGAPFTEQAAILDELLRIPNVRRCCIDAGGLGMQLAEQTVEKFGPHRVEPITFTPMTKSQLAMALRIAVETRSIRIPNDDRVRNDWHSVERTITSSGQFRLQAARREGSHADRFWAAALALRAAGACGVGGLAFGPIDWMPGRPLVLARGGTW